MELDHATMKVKEPHKHYLFNTIESKTSILELQEFSILMDQDLINLMEELLVISSVKQSEMILSQYMVMDLKPEVSAIFQIKSMVWSN